MGNFILFYFNVWRIWSLDHNQDLTFGRLGEAIPKNLLLQSCFSEFSVEIYIYSVVKIWAQCCPCPDASYRPVSYNPFPPNHLLINPQTLWKSFMKFSHIYETVSWNDYTLSVWHSPWVPECQSLKVVCLFNTLCS